MQRNEPAETGKATPAPAEGNNTVENESALNTLSSKNKKQEIGDLAAEAFSAEAEIINQFMAQFVVNVPDRHTAWPKNVSVFASSRYDQTSGTNSGLRSRTGVYTDALLESAGLSGHPRGIGALFAAALVQSLHTSHTHAQNALKNRGGIFAMINPESGQTPQTSARAQSVHFTGKLSKDSHAIFLSGFDSRHDMHLGFKDDMDNMHRLSRKLGIPDRNVSEFSNVKKTVLEAYLKDFKGKTGDRFVIYYSGHGSSMLSEKGRSVVEQNLMKFDKLSEQQAKNVISFIADRSECQTFAKIAKSAGSPVMELVRRRFPEYYEKMMKGLEKESGLSRKELQAALGLLRFGHGASLTAVQTSVFKVLGANDPKHYDGVLHSNGSLTERDLKRMTAQYLSGFKNVVIISDSCYAGALIADRGAPPGALTEQSPEREAA